MNVNKAITVVGLTLMLLLGLTYFGVFNIQDIPFLSPAAVEAPTESHFEQNEVDFKFSFDFDEPVEYTLKINEEQMEYFTLAESSTSHETTVTLDQGVYDWNAVFETSNSRIERSDQFTIEIEAEDEEGAQVLEDFQEAEDEDIDDAEIGDELEGEVE